MQSVLFYTYIAIVLYTFVLRGSVEIRFNFKKKIITKTNVCFLGALIQSNTIQSRSYYFTHFGEIMEPMADSNSVWKLCYRASFHGWAASIFHSNCDGKRDTVTIIRKDQYVFGGYTDIPWGKKI